MLDFISFGNEDKVKAFNEDEEYTANSSKNLHIVKKGESLYSISKLYGLTVVELKRANKLSSDLVFTGQELITNKTIGSTNLYSSKIC